MPALKGNGKGPSERINIRLDEETMHFYKVKAHQHGVSVSDYLRQLLVQGVISENVHEIEQRLRSLIAEINTGGHGGDNLAIPDELLLSMFTSEALLTAIVEARDVQQLYEAQDKAKARLARLKGAVNGKA